MRTINFQRFGDFYEAFGDDAYTLAEVCGLVVTKRSRTDDTPACGIPVHSAFDRFAELRSAGITPLILGEEIV